jgi:hypothetical protein
MFATLNMRWLIHLREGEMHLLDRTANNPQPQKWLQMLVRWCKRLI